MPTTQHTPGPLNASYNPRRAKVLLRRALKYQETMNLTPSRDLLYLKAEAGLKICLEEVEIIVKAEIKLTPAGNTLLARLARSNDLAAKLGRIVRETPDNEKARAALNQAKGE